MNKLLDKKLFHNPRCSKSRQALALLEEHKVEFEVFFYLKEELNRAIIKELLSKLNLAPRDLLRKSEQAYKNFNLSDINISDEKIIDAMINYPKLIERPVFIIKKKAIMMNLKRNCKWPMNYTKVKKRN